ncbi:MAG TPA: IclR family transcriptional regulator C-terminal domain-containing protein [Steroidobacteraceae bacterium]|nr:IclR family transcriptional regulator C-terminal domain-containing protein [Steroidobacteraceae bacterium]
MRSQLMRGARNSGAEDGEYITSLARGLAVLRAFSKEHPEMTLSQVASATRLSAATARRCLHTLVDLGYAAKRGKLFLLRPAVVSFASAYLESMNLEQIVRPYLQEVRDKTGDSSSLAVLSDTEILYLVHVSTNRMVRVPCTVGTRFPAFATSLGRVLLAYQPKDALDDYFRKARLTALTEKTLTSKSALRNLLAKVREERCAATEDELDYGLVSVAVPIFNAENQIIAAVNCSTSTARADKAEMIATRVPVLREAARSIEVELRRYPMLAHSMAL